MIPSSIDAADIVAAARWLDAQPDEARRASRTYDVLVDGRRYPPKLVVSVAARRKLGQELDPGSFGGGAETNGFLRRLGFEIVRKGEAPATPTVAASPVTATTTVRVGRAFLDMGVRRADHRARPEGPWVAHKQIVASQLRDGRDVYRRRIVGLVEQARRAGASVVLLPACALVHDATTSIADYAFHPDLLVVSGALGLTRTGVHEHAVVLRGGVVLEDFDDRAIRWFDAGPFSVMAAISSTIAGVSKGVAPARSTTAPPRQGQSVLLLDAGHHPYSSRYHFNTLRCAARDAEAVAGAPAGLVLASWQYAGARVACSWSQPVSRVRWSRLPGSGTDLVDLVDVDLGR
jgi:hypothetical protein